VLSLQQDELGSLPDYVIFDHEAGRQVLGRALSQAHDPLKALGELPGTQKEKVLKR